MLPQNGYSEAPLTVHAYSSNKMPGGHPALKGAQFDPNTPDMEIPPYLELSESLEQVTLATPLPRSSWHLHKDTATVSMVGSSAP